LTLFACSSDSDDTNDGIGESTVLLKKIVSSSDGTTEYSYNGDKLYRITYSNGIEEYTYSGDLITNVQSLYSNGQPDGYLEFYEYENGKLINKKVYSDNELVEDDSYIYLNNTIKVIDNLELRSYSLNHLNSNGNTYKIEFFYDNQIYRNILYNFDNKNSLFKNIKGINQFILRGPGVNNNLLSMENDGVIEDTYTWQYNDSNYPISVENFDSNGNSTGSASLYY